MSKVVTKPRLTPIEGENKSKKEIKQEQIVLEQQLATATPNAYNLKKYIENILESPNAEEILNAIVEDLNKIESTYLQDEAKQKIKDQKNILGFVLSEISTFGDQYNIVCALCAKLGYRRK